MPHGVRMSTINAPYGTRTEIHGEELTGAATLRYPERYGNANVPYASDPDNATVAIDETYVRKSRFAYIYNQIKNPKMWDRGKEKTWWEKLRMGQFGLTDAEARALTVFITAQRVTHVASHLVDAMDESKRAITDARQAIKTYNCQACHSLGLYEDTLEIGLVDPEDKYAGGTTPVDLGATRLWTAEGVRGHIDLWDEDYENVIGQDIQQVVEPGTWLVGELWDKFSDPDNPDYYAVADYMAGFEIGEVPVYGRHEGWIRQFYGGDTTISPPVLYEQGKKTKPEWLFEWLTNVHTIRPHIYVRMPQFNYRGDDAERLVHFFGAMDQQPWPFEDYASRGDDKQAVALGHDVYMNLVKCNLCHPAGDSMPTNADQAAWAPNLALAQSRLKTDWVKRWLRNPQSIYPGTKMPNNFFQAAGDGLAPIVEGTEDENERQIDAITHWFHSLDPRNAQTDYASLYGAKPIGAAAAPAEGGDAASGAPAEADAWGAEETAAPAEPAAATEDTEW
jgi:cytochrome c1